MIRLFLPLLAGFMLFLTCCTSTSQYDKRLSAHVADIEKLERFESHYIDFDESTGYGHIHTNDPWTADWEFYLDDIVIEKGQLYRAIQDNKGKNPTTNPVEWVHMPYRHPYFFFRDSASIKDLEKLLIHDHRYVRLYAFGALAHRNADDLFPVILRSLNDTTKLEIQANDVGYYGYAADLMISYEKEHLSDEQKTQLKTLIEAKHRHLVSSFILLSGGYPTLRPVWPK